MRILALSTWWPEPADNGIKLRLSRLLQALAASHEVHLLALCRDMPGAADQELPLPYCATALAERAPATPLHLGSPVVSLWSTRPASVRAAWSAHFANLVRRSAITLNPDIVVAFELSSAPYALLLPRVPRVLDDLEMAALHDEFTTATGRQRLRRWLTWTKHRSYVRHILRGFAGYTTVSAHEAALARPLAPATAEMEILPNGADIEGAPPLTELEPDTLIYPGALSYQANHDAMGYFLEQIFPQIHLMHPATRLRITGRATAAQIAALPECEGVEFTGFVPDIKALVARSWAEVVPLREGSGTRLKILEALALGTPVISTSKGAEGLDLVPGRDFLIADTPAAFAETTVHLLTHPEERARLSANGRRAVAERYDWLTIGARFVALVETVATQKKLGYDTRIHTA